MQISSVILRVADVEKSTAFWSETVGLDVSLQIPNFTFLNGGDVQLILSYIDGGVTDESLTEVVFSSEDVRATYDDLMSRGVAYDVELRPINSDGERDLLAASFRDPDGHWGSLTGWVEKS